MLGDTLDWPWFTDDHRRYATKLVRWANRTLPTCRTTTSTRPAGRVFGFLG